MSSEDIKRLVSKSETAAVEFKRARGGIPADFWPSYSAFEPSIVESYEPDRTKVTVEYEPDESELGVIDSEVGEKTGVSDDVKPISDYVNHDFEVLMGAYRSDFRLDNCRGIIQKRSCSGCLRMG